MYVCMYVCMYEPLCTPSLSVGTRNYQFFSESKQHSVFIPISTQDT